MVGVCRCHHCCWQQVIVELLTLAQHWSNTKVSTIVVLLLIQRWQYNDAATEVEPVMAQYMPADCTRVCNYVG